MSVSDFQTRFSIAIASLYSYTEIIVFCQGNSLHLCNIIARVLGNKALFILNFYRKVKSAFAQHPAFSHSSNLAKTGAFA